MLVDIDVVAVSVGAVFVPVSGAIFVGLVLILVVATLLFLPSSSAEWCGRFSRSSDTISRKIMKFVISSLTNSSYAVSILYTTYISIYFYIFLQFWRKKRNITLI